MTENVFEKLVSGLIVDDEKAAKLECDFYAQHVDEWWNKIARDLPDWPWARFGNSEWERRCDKRVLDAVRQWPVFVLDKQTRKLSPRGMLLTASTGSGKSTAVLARLWKASENLRAATVQGKAKVKYPPPIAWMTEKQLLKASWDDDETMTRARKVSLLVVDELGFAGGHDSAKGKTPVILDVLCSRYDMGLPTVITSGLTVEQLASRYGSAIVRRMQTGSDVLDLAGGR